MKKMMMILAAVLMASVAAQADLTWRVDINGMAADASTNTPGWTGWNIGNGSTNVAGFGTARSFTVGSVTGSVNMIARLMVSNAVGGNNNFSTIDRSLTNNAIDPVSFWADGVQGSATNKLGNSGLYIRFENLAANSDYQVSLFSADMGNTYSTITQSFFNATDNMLFGTLTNRSGQASSLVPTSQYDSRYTVSVTLTTDANGMITIREFGNGANARLNGFEVVAVPEPATVGMLGLGAIVTLLVRRMKR